jgi:hypothetical protein
MGTVLLITGNLIADVLLAVTDPRHQISSIVGQAAVSLQEDILNKGHGKPCPYELVKVADSMTEPRSNPPEPSASSTEGDLFRRPRFVDEGRRRRVEVADRRAKVKCSPDTPRGIETQFDRRRVRRFNWRSSNCAKIGSP